MQSEMTTLKNGLRIITSSRPQTETVSLGIWVKTGAAYEKQEVNGISHFLEHMAFKGTNKRNALQISEEIEDVGGQSNAYTSREFTAFYCKMLKGDTELAVDVLTDILQTQLFPRMNWLRNAKSSFRKSNRLSTPPTTSCLIIFRKPLFPIRPSDVQSWARRKTFAVLPEKSSIII